MTGAAAARPRRDPSRPPRDDRPCRSAACRSTARSSSLIVHLAAPDHRAARQLVPPAGRRGSHAAGGRRSSRRGTSRSTTTPTSSPRTASPRRSSTACSSRSRPRSSPIARGVRRVRVRVDGASRAGTCSSSIVVGPARRPAPDDVHPAPDTSFGTPASGPQITGTVPGGLAGAHRLRPAVRDLPAAQLHAAACPRRCSSRPRSTAPARDGVLPAGPPDERPGDRGAGDLPVPVGLERPARRPDVYLGPVPANLPLTVAIANLSRRSAAAGSS